MVKTHMLWLLLASTLSFASTADVQTAAEKVQSTLQADFARVGYQEIKIDLTDKVTVAAEDNVGKAVIVHVNNSLASSPKITLDGWTSILCHESGHVLGGAPYLGDDPDDWGEVSAEGQADYFAAAKCLRRVWVNDAENETYLSHLDPAEVKTIRFLGCKTDVCVKIVAVNFELLKAVNPDEPISLTNRSKQIVKETESSRNSAPSQCRLDTSLAGALCEVDPKIPFASGNQRDGACTTGPGARPACWFAPASLDQSY